VDLELQDLRVGIIPCKDPEEEAIGMGLWYSSTYVVFLKETVMRRVLCKNGNLYAVHDFLTKVID